MENPELQAAPNGTPKAASFTSTVLAFAMVTDVIILDQVSKWLIKEYLTAPVPFFAGISLDYHENTGIAWSLPVPPEVIIPVNIALVALLIWLGSHHLNFRYHTAKIAFALTIGGAAGNIIDRLARGYVIDFINLGWWPVFNLADAFLAIGIFLFIANYGKITRVSENSQP